MADDAKAKKIAAARKKLKAYQTKERTSDVPKPAQIDPEILGASELKESQSTETCASANSQTEIRAPATSSNASVASFSKSNTSSFDSETVSINGNHHANHSLPPEHHFLPTSNDLVHSNTIELLINEKASLCAELGHYKAECKEKSLSAEEANVRLQDTLKRIEKLGKDLLSSQSHNVQLQSNVDRLNVSAVQSGMEIDKLKQDNIELREHVEELKQAVQKGVEQIKVLEEQLKEKDCELELSRIRINQISDVASVENDSKVETLIQTKFMHEQQIRDLQAMVQQLETEREQSSQQYQSYVQHLNKEIASLSERNEKLDDDNNRQKEREESLVKHLSTLEKQIQQMIAQQAKQMSKVEHVIDTNMITQEDFDLKMQDMLNEKQILAEKTQIQEVQISDMQRLMNEKLEYIQTIEEKLANYLSLQSDSTKLLAKVESNSVAASRAVSQNEELKRQLEEVQTKLIQVTNDKVELTNQLDSERYLNREMRTNYENMEKQVATLTEKLHFKDEEMIRLTKENNALNSRIETMQTQSGSVNIYQDIEKDHEHNSGHDHSHDCDHTNDHKAEEHHTHDEHSCDHEDKHGHSHNHDHSAGDSHNHSHHNDHENHKHQEPLLESIANQMSPLIPPGEAMQKLETRFKSLMNDVANLTDEKQRLEHLVLQLQSETDTIGEYIALYQAQRRVLKQREIEKNTQLMKLKSEREELHSKLTLLNQLVNNLSHQVGVGIATNNNINIPSQQVDDRIPTVELTFPGSITSPPEMSKSETSLSNPKQLNSSQIIHAIQNIVENIKNTESTDLDLNVVSTLDHCSCCSGKFETI